jgi:hypothetical protein
MVWASRISAAVDAIVERDDRTIRHLDICCSVSFLRLMSFVEFSQMARTKPTARKSTGDKTPRKHLLAQYARKNGPCLLSHFSGAQSEFNQPSA